MSEEALALQLDGYFRHVKPMSYKRRTLILHANDTPSSVFYIKSGFVRVYRISEQGEELTLTILKPQDFFPLTYGFHEMRNPYFLEAMTSLEIYKAPVEEFVQFIKDHQEIYYELTTRILLRFDGVLSRMEYLVFSNAYTKVAATLLLCAKRFGETQGNKLVLTIPLTHKDIATLIGITRETTSLEMKKLEHQGYISRSGRYIIINDPEKMNSDIFSSSDELDSHPLFHSL